MNFFGFTLLVGVSQAFVVDRTTNANLAAPFVTMFNTLSPPGFDMQWKTVLSSDANDPVLGYKVKLWRYPGEKMTKTEIIGNERLITISYKYPKIPDVAIPPGQPWQDLSVPIDRRELKLENLEHNVLYDVRVQAFTNKRDGPLSGPRSVTFEGP